STATITPTAPPTSTPTPTPGANDCCQCSFSGQAACGPPVSGACVSGCVPVFNAVCLGTGNCAVRTPSPTVTLSATVTPTRTATVPPSATLSSTPTATPGVPTDTPTITPTPVPSCITILPSAEGDLTENEPSGFPENWKCARTNDGDTSYVFRLQTSSAPPLNDLYELDQVAPRPEAITAVFVHTVSRSVNRS